MFHFRFQDANFTAANGTSKKRPAETVSEAKVYLINHSYSIMHESLVIFNFKRNFLNDF